MTELARAKRFADLGWAGGKDERGALVVAVDVGSETTCVSTFPRGYENSTSVLMPTAALAGDPHAFRTLERNSFAVGSTALAQWPSDRVLRGSAGSLRLSSQIGLVEFPGDHVLAGLIAKAGEQHGRQAEQIVTVLPPFLPADRIDRIRATVKEKSRLKLAGKNVPPWVAGAYFYLLPALRHAIDKPAANELEKWSLDALADGRLLVLDCGASALTYAVVDLSIREKTNELKLVTAGAWPALGGHELTFQIFDELKKQATDAIVRAGPADLRGRLDKERMKSDVWKPDFYDDAFLELKRIIQNRRIHSDPPDKPGGGGGDASPQIEARERELRNLLFPTVWHWPNPSDEPRGYASFRKVAIAHARKLWEQAETIKKTALGDPVRYAKDPIPWSVLNLKSRFVDHVMPDVQMYMPARFLSDMQVELSRCLTHIDGVLEQLGRKVTHIALMGMQAASRIVSDTVVEFAAATTGPSPTRALAKAAVAPIAETALELKSVPTRGAALLLRDEAEVSLGAIPEILPFSISVADCVGNIDIFRPGPIDELTLFQRRLHVDAGFPLYEFFVWQSEDDTRAGAWGAIDFGKPEQWTADDRTVRVDERFRFGKSGVELPRFRNWKKDTTEIDKCFDRNGAKPSLDGRISLRDWIPKGDEPGKLLAFIESDLVTTFRKRVFLLEREFDPPPEKFEFVYQRYYLSQIQELIVVREWWAPAAGETRLRRNKTLHVCIGSTQARGILGTEWGRH